MSSAPPVSVIVPVLNGERFLAECLEAILAQDHEPFEVIVVDDGSTDASSEVAASFDGVQVLRRAHEGLHAARNAGIDASSGELIAWCDSDDVWFPHKLSAQVAHLDAHPACDVILARMEVRLEEGTPWPRWLRRDQRLGDLDGVQMVSGLFRRPVFSRVGGFRSQTGGDFDLLIRARTAGCQIELLDDVVYLRRVHDHNTMTTSDDPEVGARALMPAVREHLRQRRR